MKYYIAAWRYDISLLVLKNISPARCFHLQKIFQQSKKTEFRISAQPCNTLCVLFLKTLKPSIWVEGYSYLHMTPDLGIEPGPHWWEASALTTAPSLQPFHCLVFTKHYAVSYEKLPQLPVKLTRQLEKQTLTKI